MKGFFFFFFWEHFQLSSLQNYLANQHFEVLKLEFNDGTRVSKTQAASGGNLIWKKKIHMEVLASLDLPFQVPNILSLLQISSSSFSDLLQIFFFFGSSSIKFDFERFEFHVSCASTKTRVLKARFLLPNSSLKDSRGQFQNLDN